RWVGGGEEVGWAGKLEGSEGRAARRGLSPAVPAIDGDARRVGDAASDGPFDRVDQVVVHPAGPFEVGGVDKGFPDPGRAAVVDAEHRIAAIGEPLVRGVKTPAVTRPWAAVHEEDERKRLALL